MVSNCASHASDLTSLKLRSEDKLGVLLVYCLVSSLVAVLHKIGRLPMTSAYVTDLRHRLRASRDRLDDELKHVPPDYTKAAFYERQIAQLFEEIKMCSTTEVLGKVVFGVTAEQGEFPNFDCELPTSNNEVLLEDIEKRLCWHNPPLRLKTVNNVPATARPSNKTLVANFKDGDRLELVADIAPDPPEGRVKHQTKMYNVAWWGAMLVVAGLVLTALYTP